MNDDTSARPARSLPRYKTLLCCACVAILVANGWAALRSLDGLRSANAQQAQSAHVVDELQYVNLVVTDSEAALRGYFLSGADSYLGPLRNAPQEVEREFATLTTLLADNPSQLKNLGQLRSLVERRLAGMQQALDVYRKGGLSDIIAIARSPDSRQHMDEIRLQVVIMTGLQNEQLGRRREAFYHQYHQAVWLGLGINALAIVVIMLFYGGIRRSFGLRLAAERALQQANDQLETTVALRTEQLSVLSRHLIRVAEEEKSRLSRELHDEMGANLTAIGIDLASVYDRLRETEPELAAMLARARGTLVDTVQLKRRIIENLRPSLLDNMGLAAALHSYCGDYARVTGVECDALIEGEVDATGPMQAIALFRIAQEALNNVAKYAKARHVTVHLARAPDGLTLLVEDDGIGIAPEALARPKSHGLLGMRERALLLGGTLTVERGAGGKGTCVSAWIPIAPLDGEAKISALETSPELPADGPLSPVLPAQGAELRVSGQHP